ncbi:MAG: hypothetical protein V4850_08790 [Myxococcota bacterium]
MFPLLVAAAEASRGLTDLCGADLVVVATVESLTSERRPNGYFGTLATLYVDRMIVGAPVAVVQTRYRGGTMDGVSSSASGEPVLRHGARYLLVFRNRPDRPLPSLASWNEAPMDIELPDAGTLHFGWDTMCATGPVKWASIDALRGTLGDMWTEPAPDRPQP